VPYSEPSGLNSFVPTASGGGTPGFEVSADVRAFAATSAGADTGADASAGSGAGAGAGVSAGTGAGVAGGVACSGRGFERSKVASRKMALSTFEKELLVVRLLLNLLDVDHATFVVNHL